MATKLLKHTNLLNKLNTLHKYWLSSVGITLSTKCVLDVIDQNNTS